MANTINTLIIFICIYCLSNVKSLELNCRNTFRSEDWIYCVKFGTPSNLGFQA